jgi:rRNA maturation RNase YbeY
MADISFHCDDAAFQWNEESSIAQWLLKIAQTEKLTLRELSYVYCSDERLLQMNQEHLGHDYYTDIITFDLSDDDGIEGEIYISLDRVAENAKTFNESFETELCRVMAHGLLHLAGYDDHSDADITTMRAKETFCLSLLSEVPRGTFLD